MSAGRTRTWAGARQQLGRAWVLAAVALAAQAGAATTDWTVKTLAGTGMAGTSPDGTRAGAAPLNNPFGIIRGPDGAIYLCDTGNHQVRRILPEGRIETVAGNGRAGYAGDGGAATRAELNEPYEVRFDSHRNLFFVEMRNHVVRRVDARTGTISTVAGTGLPGFSGDGGPATRAQLRQPHSIQFDRADNLYLCDIGNHRIRRVAAGTGVISTFAGTGKPAPTRDGGRIDEVDLNGPRAVDFDRAGNLWLALREGNAIYRLDLAAGTVQHRAGTGKKGNRGNGGPARAADLSGPKGISVGPDGNVYFADTESHTIRRLNVADATVELIAGMGVAGDGPEGPAGQCRFARPHGIYVDADGSVLVGDSEAHRVRVIRRGGSAQ